MTLAPLPDASQKAPRTRHQTFPSIADLAQRLARALVLLAVVLLSGCQREVLPPASGSEAYVFNITMTSTTLPGGIAGTRLGVQVYPPDPRDPEQRAFARRLEDEFLRRMAPGPDVRP